MVFMDIGKWNCNIRSVAEGEIVCSNSNERLIVEEEEVTGEMVNNRKELIVMKVW